MPNEDLPDAPAQWKEAERELYRNALASRPTSFGGGDPNGGEGWGPERTIRAAVVRRLLTDKNLAPGLVRLSLRGARIVDVLDLEAATLNGTLELYNCHCSEIINLEQATAPAIYLEHCNLAGVKAGQLHTTHSFTLIGSTCAFLKLTGAHIAGQLDLKDVTLTGLAGSDCTLMASTISVASNATLKRIKVNGTLDLMGAKIGGQLILREGTLSHRGQRAFLGIGMKVEQDTFFDNGFSANGSVDLTGAAIGGSLHFSRAMIHHPGKDPALDLARVEIEQNMVCEDGFTVEGLVLLAGASIKGSLWANGGQFIHPADTAIDASGMKVRDIRLSTEAAHQGANRNGFRAEGTVILADAIIDGTLNCKGGSIVHPRPNMESLNARGAKLTRDLLLSHGFSASGEVALTGAEIGGQVVWTDGSFVNPGQVAISAHQLIARTSLSFEGNFLARGQVDLTGASVNGPLIAGGRIYAPEQEALILDSVATEQDLCFRQGLLVEGSLCMRTAEVGSNLKIEKPNLSHGKEGVALNLEGTTVKGTLLLKADTPVNGSVDLREVEVQFLKDDPEFWPTGNVLLAGFKYESLSDFTSPDLAARKEWLNFRGRYSAQTYNQLASVYKSAGLDDHARDVLYLGQKRRPRTHLREKVWSWLLRLTVGYGYHPARVLYAVILLEVFGWIYFSLWREDLRPSYALLSAYGGPGNESMAREHLQPALYALDLLLPVVTFGQRALWIPEGVTSWVATLLMVIGWVLGGILLYGISTAYQRRGPS